MRLCPKAAGCILSGAPNLALRVLGAPEERGGCLKVNLVATLLVGFLVGTALAQRRQVTLADLASSKADITSLDWVLVKAQIEVMSSTQPIADVGWPAYRYDTSENRLWANVFVNGRWWVQADTKTAKDTLESTGMLDCMAPFSYDPRLESLIKGNKTRCAVNFYTWRTKPVSSGSPRLELATYFADRSELVLK
jgi:hypothetical protein